MKCHFEEGDMYKKKVMKLIIIRSLMKIV